MSNTGLIQQLETRGYRGGVISTRHLNDLREEIETHHRQGLINEEFYEERLRGFSFSPPESLPEAQSLIIVAVRDPQVRFTFTRNGKRFALIVPPTFLQWRETDEEIADTLREILESAGHP